MISLQKNGMMIKPFLLLIVCSIVSFSFAQSKEAYVIFNAKGKKVAYQQMVKQAKKTDIVFFGEYHNNPIAHWLQLELSTDLMLKQKLTFGFEMFEADQQSILDDFVKGKMSQKEFEKNMRLWTNFKTDYLPLLTLANEQQFKVVASNVPRRIASLLFKNGREVLDTLSQEELQWMCEKDFVVDTTLSQYQAMFSMTTDHQKGLNFIYAQAIKDATMAKFIDQLWVPSTQFIHFNGAFHTDFDQGICWYLKRLRPHLNYVTISTVEQTQLKHLDKEHLGRAQFIICTPENMTKTH